MVSPGEHLRRFLSDSRTVIAGATRALHRYSKFSLVFWIAVLTVAAIAHVADAPIAAALSSPGRNGLRVLAVALSRWGYYGTGVLMLSVAMWLIGAIANNGKLRRAAIACFLAATLALLAVNVVKTVAGRPRPYTGMPDQFTGLNMEESLRSFPSGHSASAMAAATAISVAYPAAAAPAALIAVGVAWSRMYLEQHYLTDVIVGSAFGIWFGILFGLAVRQRETTSAKTSSP